MATFELKSQLPLATQNEIDRVQAITSAQRTVKEAAFLTALAPYLTNEVLEYDNDNLIVNAAGNTLPTGYTGFKKGALFTDKDASANGLYVNIGDHTSASWQVVNQNASQITARAATPVNAVAASKVLTVSDLPADNDTVTVGGKTYTFQSAIGTASAATGTLTVSDTPHANDEVVIGDNTYKFVSALTEAKATGTLTATANPQDGARVKIGSTTYTFRDTLVDAYDVKIGVSASASLDNLIAAINKAAGEGSTYGTGTVVHPTVAAAAGDGDTMTATAKSVGVAGNEVTTTEFSPGLAWGAETMENGVDSVANEVLIGANAEGSIDNLVLAITAGTGAGTNYSTATVASTQVTAVKATAATMTVTAKATGDAGNAIATTITEGGSTHESFGAATLTGGEGAEAANDVLIGVSAEACIDNLVAAINASEGAGTTYGTGTTANANVTAAKTTTATMTATAKVKGEVGNDIVIGKSGANLAWAAGATKLSGGVNGTAGAAKEICADASYLYIATAANTTADANWRRVSLGSAY